MIYRHRPRSYRELPLRLAEYGVVYRHEDSGALSGLIRVRMISQNDAHIYCAPDHLRDEFRAVLELHKFYYDKLRIKDHRLRLSLHDPAKKEKFLDNPEAWSFSERTIREILEELKVEYEEGFGEAAFYGPKVDYQIRNVLGREETASTNQLDFAASTRFNLTYVGEDGKHHPLYVIHRAPLGSHERFVAFLIEHYGGAFPTWMSPLQVRIIPVADKFAEYAHKLADELRSDLVRVDLDLSAETFNKRLRSAITHKIPNMLIVGGKEVEAQSVTWRRYCSPEQRSLPWAEFRTLLKTMISERKMDNFADEPL